MKAEPGSEGRERIRIQWVDQAPRQVAYEAPELAVAGLVRRMEGPEAAAVIAATGLQPLVVVERDCYEAVLNHVGAHDVETGGLLLGKVYGSADGARVAVISVTRHVAPEHVRGTSVSVDIPADAWSRARELADQEGLLVLGWYHSHPDLGVFFSQTDRRTQAGFFRHDYSVGAVFDPVRHQEKWFLGLGSVELRYRPLVFPMLTDRPEAALPVAATDRPKPLIDRARGRAHMIGLMLVSSFATGLLIWVALLAERS